MHTSHRNKRKYPNKHGHNFSIESTDYPDTTQQLILKIDQKLIPHVCKNTSSVVNEENDVTHSTDWRTTSFSGACLDIRSATLLTFTTNLV